MQYRVSFVTYCIECVITRSMTNVHAYMHIWVIVAAGNATLFVQVYNKHDKERQCEIYMDRLENCTTQPTTVLTATNRIQQQPGNW